MSGTPIDLIIQTVAGVIGGQAAGAALKDSTLGTIGNTIAGAIGGVAGGQLLAQLMPALANTAGHVDVGALGRQIICGRRGGALLARLAGLAEMVGGPPKTD